MLQPILCFSFAFLIHTIFAEQQPFASAIFKHLPSIEITQHNSGLRLIDCIYVINLNERPERWERTQSMCQKYHIYPNRVSAINGWLIPDEEQDELAHPFPRRLRGGQLGCLLSHLSILADAKQRNFDFIWVMEDDIEILEDPKVLVKMIAGLLSLDANWDIFYTDVDFRDDQGGYVRSYDTDFRPGENPTNHYLERLNITKDIMRIGCRFGTHSMIISKKGIEKIYKYFTTRPLWTAIDIDIHYIPEIREYSSRRDIVSNLLSSPSDTLPSSLFNLAN